MVKNKLIRLAELIQEGFSENIVEAFKSGEKPSLADRLAISNRAITAHQAHAEALWLDAGRQRSPAERSVAARAELAAFLFAYLSGEAAEYADSAIEALRVLGRQGEADLIQSLARR